MRKLSYFITSYLHLGPIKMIPFNKPMILPSTIKDWNLSKALLFIYITSWSLSRSSSACTNQCETFACVIIYMGQHYSLLGAEGLQMFFHPNGALYRFWLSNSWKMTIQLKANNLIPKRSYFLLCVHSLFTLLLVYIHHTGSSTEP